MLEGIADVSKNDENPFYVLNPIVYIECIDSIEKFFLPWSSLSSFPIPLHSNVF